MKTSKAYFIINPISGGKSKSHVENLIYSGLSGLDMEIEIVYSQYAGHAETLAIAAIRNNFDLIVAVGGDGTINEVAKNLVGTGVKFGIIPFGSGNGLARFLKIPISTKKAIENIRDGVPLAIDSATLNSIPFFNMAGVGLDAKIGHIFSTNEIRGFKTYIKLVLKELMNIKATPYKITIDGKPYDENVYMISIANSSQYGNNMNIAKDASIVDGLLDVCIFQAFPIWMLPYYGLAMRLKALKSKHLKIVKGKEITIERDASFYAHTDGEPHVVEGQVKIKVLPLSLNIIVPKK